MSLERLHKFLEKSSNSVSRERLFFHRLYFDLKVAAARAGYALTLFEPDVDRQGFDIVLGGQDHDRRFQLKTVLKCAATHSWETTKVFMRPEPLYNKHLGFESSGEGIGFGGGLIVIEVDDTKIDCPVRYLYTDIFVIMALHHGLVFHVDNRVRQRRQKQADAYVRALRRGRGDEKLAIAEGLLVPVKSPDHLLAIVGFFSSVDSLFWFNNFLFALRDGFGIDENGQPRSGVPAEVVGSAQYSADKLLMLIEDNFGLRRFGK